MKRRLIAVTTAAALLAGCASPQTDYSASAAAKLQERVLAVTTAAADGDVVAALLRLQELEAAAYDAAARSLISQARLASILSSIALVRSDLEKALSEGELAEAQQRLDELEQARVDAPAAPGAGGSTGTGDVDADSEAQRAAEERAAKKATEQQKKEEEAAKKAAEEQRKAEEEARKKAEDEAKKAEEAAKKQREEAQKQAEDDGGDDDEGDG